ncbi:MAG: hypothetical protein K2F87_06425 [Muribaculaceae bacterium]|nr:hypothetical protein [Muribaculaceae bacterium]
MITSIITSVGAAILTATPALASPTTANIVTEHYVCRNVKGVSALEGPQPDDKIIVDPMPELPRETMVKTGWGYAITDAGNMMKLNSTGSVNMLVRDGSHIYISNPMSLIPVEGWLEGDIEGDKVTLKLPQFVQQRIVESGVRPKTYNDYIVALDYGEDEEGGWYFPCPEQTYVFTIRPDGTWIPEDESVLLGHCVWVDPKEYGVEDEPAQWDWVGAGDLYTSLAPVTSTGIEAPAGLAFSPYNLIYNNIYKGVEVAFDGEDVYFKGMCTFDPSLADALIKGRLADGKITLPTGQYFGVSQEYLNVIYFMAGDSQLVKDEDGRQYRKFDMTEALVYNYDPEKKMMTTEDDYCMSVTMSEPYYYDFVLDGCLREADPNLKPEQLLAPIHWGFYPQNDEYGLPNQIEFIIPQVSADLVPLDTNHIFYQVFVDNNLFEFLPDEYLMLTEPMTEVPFGFSDDWDFYGQGALQYVYINPFDVESIAVRTLYHNLDGTVTYSPKLWFLGEDPNSGALSIAGETSEAVSTEWFDLTGRRLSGPAKGIMLRADRLSDGSLRTSKIAIP